MRRENSDGPDGGSRERPEGEREVIGVNPSDARTNGPDGGSFDSGPIPAFQLFTLKKGCDQTLSYGQSLVTARPQSVPRQYSARIPAIPRKIQITRCRRYSKLFRRKFNQTSKFRRRNLVEPIERVPMLLDESPDVTPELLHRTAIRPGFVFGFVGHATHLSPLRRAAFSNKLIDRLLKSVFINLSRLQPLSQFRVVEPSQALHHKFGLLPP